MIKIYNRIINIGIYNNTLNEHKKIRLLNVFCLTWGIFIMFFILSDPFFGKDFNKSIKAHLLSIVCIFLVFILQKIKAYTLARVVFILAITSLTFIFAVYIEDVRLMENFYFIYPLVALVFIDEKWITISILCICFLLYYLPSKFGLVDYQEGMMNPVLILTVFAANYIILNYSKVLNKKNEEKLQKNKQELELAYLELEESKKNEYADLKLKSLRAQMNPHFMFNALNSIQDLILKQDTDASYDYIVMFAQLIRDTLNYSNQDFISIEEELEFLKIYLELEKLRIGNEFNYTIDYKENESIEVPSLLIQPFIENALVHGLIHKTGKKELHIDFKLTKKALECTITDNGIGRQKAELIVKRQGNNHKSFALDAIEKRLEVFYKKYYEKVGYNIIDLYENENAIGTKVVLTIPYKMRF